jgi:hypothetical protein
VKVRQKITVQLWPPPKQYRTPGILSPTAPPIMANTTTTPKHTDPATKRDEKKNEEVIKDKPSGKAVKTQKK